MTQQYGKEHSKTQNRDPNRDPFFLIFFIVVFFSGCGRQWSDHDAPTPAPAPFVPGRIVTLNPELQPGLDEAVAIWTEHQGEAPFAETGEVEVTVELAPSDHAGLAVGGRGWGGCEIYVSDTIPLYPHLHGYLVELLVHEIGHCLGYWHDEDITSAMYPTWAPGQTLKDHHR